MAMSPWRVPVGRHTRGDARLTLCLRRPTASQDFAVGYDSVCHGNRVRNSAIRLAVWLISCTVKPSRCQRNRRRSRVVQQTSSSTCHTWWPVVLSWFMAAPWRACFAEVLAADPARGSRPAQYRRQVGRCRSLPDPRVSAKPISMSTHPVRYLTGPCRLQRDSRWPYRPADVRSSCSRWLAIS